jgi:hypothetical protein
VIDEGMDDDPHCLVLVTMQKRQCLGEPPAVRIAKQDALLTYET